MSTNYIYLLCEREFIKTNEPIYKIGRSLQENLKRIQSYPNGSKLLLQSICEDCTDSEKELIKLFKLNFIHRNDIGNEYFEGNCYKMIQIMTEYLITTFTQKNLFDIVHNVEDKSDENTESVKDKNYENTENDEEEEHEHEFIIDNIDEYLKVSTIEKIIITNEKTTEGYLRLKTTSNHLWHKIFACGTSEEDLMGFLENCHNEDCYVKNNTIVTFNYRRMHSEFEDIKRHRVNCNYEEIYRCIKKKCYQKIPNRINLKNNMYIMQCKDNSGNRKYLQLNAKDFTFSDISHELNDTIITLDDCGVMMSFKLYQNIIHCLEEINTKIVCEILQILIGDQDEYIKFKRLCYYIFNGTYIENPILFEDKTGGFLTSWLKRAMEFVRMNGNYIDYFDNDKLTSSEYINKSNKIIFLHNNTKFIKKVETIKKKTHISIFVNTKIYCDRNKYNQLNKFIFENKHLILDLVQDKECIFSPIFYQRLKDNELNETDIDNIFYKYSFLGINFLKWCCVIY
jgi:hypothetical protein